MFAYCRTASSNVIAVNVSAVKNVNIKSSLLFVRTSELKREDLLTYRVKFSFYTLTESRPECIAAF